MKVWPKTYKVVLVLTIVMIAVAGALFYFVLMPRMEEHEETLSELEKQRNTIKASEWDSSEEAIRRVTMDYTAALQGSKKQVGHQQLSDELLKSCTRRLQSLVDAVKEESKNPSITNDGKKTYSDLYDSVKKQLLEKEIEIVPEVFGMGHSSEGNYYNMALKMLLVREVTELLLNNHLRISRTAAEYAPEVSQLLAEDLENVKKIHPSDISVKPVKSFVLRDGDDPYLLEVSIRVTVEGSLANLMAFAVELDKNDRHYSMSNLELQTEKPILRGGRRAQLIWGQEDEKKVSIRRVQATFVCSGFALPEVDRTKEALEKLKGGSKKPVKAEEPETPADRPLGI